MNPKKYKSDDYNKARKLTAKEIWDRDNRRLEFIKNELKIPENNIKIIWESDYKINKINVLSLLK